MADAGELDLTGGRLNITCRAGDDVAFDLPTLVDLSAWTWTAQIRAEPGHDNPVLGEFTFTLSADKAICRIANAVTGVLPSKCVYDIQVSLSGTKRTLLSGTIKTLLDVTL